ncbi:MAG: glycosyltransferase family 4 protein [Acidimicrobiia bacterium]|nr:glycosyltransferase family 4 protein [Acidimicrobiia bacterium]
MHRTGRLGFVTPRYGDAVIGGAETVMREAAHGLAARGWDVEVLTTCARDHFSWANEYEAGVTEEWGVTVRRFPTVTDTPRAERAEIEAAILGGERPSIELQQRWMNDDVRVPGLYHHLLDHDDDYRALVFAPYLFWPSFACAQVAPGRTILMPCLHDEPHAELELFDPLFTGVRGLWFLSEPERDLAARLHDELAPHEVIGSGVDVPDDYDAGAFRERFGITAPFVYYAGRREGGKNWERLLDGFAAAVQRTDIPLHLVTSGTGEVRPPAAIVDRVVDLGFLEEKDRNDAFSAAAAYVQPSPYESFSRTLMEAWLAGTLPIANAASDVVAWHMARAGSGLLYDDDFELEQCLRFVAEAPDAAATLAAPGREYVLAHYTWDPVLDRMEATIDSWMPGS